MVSAIGAAISGLNAAQTRLSVSASNIANQRSTSRIENGVRVQEPYIPQRVVQSAIAPQGGVRADVQAVDPATVKAYDPDIPSADENGIVEFPNVNIEEQLVNTKVAGYDYKANLKVLKTQDEITKSLLDIFS